MPISEFRRREAEVLFEIELLLHRWGLSRFGYDEEEQTFCDQNGRTVLSRRYADRDQLFGGR